MIELGYQPEGMWPRWTDGPGAGGVWKQSEGDFVVEEIPLVEPTGEGEHQWFRIEKVGRTTFDVVEALARSAGVSGDAVGFAGMKDRFARTVQDFTVQLGKPVTDLGPGMTILARNQTRKRLRVGQLLGNRFTLRIDGGDAVRARERLERLAVTGMPNYYGVQRVGGDAPAQGRAILLGSGPRLRHRELKFALSAFQSLLFNRVLAARGSTRLEGDLCEEGVPTGPMFGHDMEWPTGAALALEQSIWQAEQMPDSCWRRFGKLCMGTRRRLWVPVDATVEPIAGGLRLAFVLPAGSYATVLLEEVL